MPSSTGLPVRTNTINGKSQPSVSAAQAIQSDNQPSRSLREFNSVDELPTGFRVQSRPYLLKPAVRSNLLALEVGTNEVLLLGLAGKTSGIVWESTKASLKIDGYKEISFGSMSPQLCANLIKLRDAAEEDNPISDNEASKSAARELFIDIFEAAMSVDASDIHLCVRNTEDTAAVLFRIYGQVRKWRSLPGKQVRDSCGVAFTMMHEERTNSAESFNHLDPQSCMIPLQFDQRTYVLRCQSHPTVGKDNFDVSMRVLNYSLEAKVKTYEQLGYLPSQIQLIDWGVARTKGGIFIAGPTGSGKTTTLSSMMQLQPNRNKLRSISMEDPVETRMQGVSQFSLQRGAGESGESAFETAQRAVLRMDPDILMQGEIRDHASAMSMYNVIDSGHAGRATVHAKNGLGIIGRLTGDTIRLPLSVVCDEEFITLLMFQMLLPVLCEHCKIPAVKSMEASHLLLYERKFGLDPKKFYVASDDGCPHCLKPGMNIFREPGAKLGIKGQTVAAEVIKPDLNLLDLIQQGRSVEAKRYWRSWRKAAFDHPDMTGKTAFEHGLYLLSIGRVDPILFESIFEPAIGYEIQAN